MDAIVLPPFPLPMNQPAAAPMIAPTMSGFTTEPSSRLDASGPNVKRCYSEQHHHEHPRGEPAIQPRLELEAGRRGPDRAGACLERSAGAPVGVSRNADQVRAAKFGRKSRVHRYALTATPAEGSTYCRSSVRNLSELAVEPKPDGQVMIVWALTNAWVWK